MTFQAIKNWDCTANKPSIQEQLKSLPSRRGKLNPEGKTKCKKKMVNLWANINKKRQYKSIMIFLSDWLVVWKQGVIKMLDKNIRNGKKWSVEMF